MAQYIISVIRSCKVWAVPALQHVPLVVRPVYVALLIPSTYIRLGFYRQALFKVWTYIHLSPSLFRIRQTVYVRHLFSLKVERTTTTFSEVFLYRSTTTTVRWGDVGLVYEVHRDRLKIGGRTPIPASTAVSITFKGYTRRQHTSLDTLFLMARPPSPVVLPREPVTVNMKRTGGLP